MSKVIRVPASEQMVEDLEELKELLGAKTTAEAVRRAIATELLLRKRLRKAKVLKIQGDAPEGEELDVLLG